VDHKLEEARLLLDVALRLADGRDLNKPLAILGGNSAERRGRGHEEVLAGANPWMGALLQQVASMVEPGGDGLRSGDGEPQQLRQRHRTNDERRQG
jgi:hypothetical protein